MRFYCLYCFKTLPKRDERCPRCKQISRDADRRIYWNLKPEFLRLQKVIAVVALVLAYFVGAQLVGPGSGTGGGGLIAIPIGMFIGVTRTSRKLTRHMPYFHAGLFWPLVFITLGVGLGFMVHPFLTPVGFLAIPVIFLCRKAQRWKDHLRDPDHPPRQPKKPKRSWPPPGRRMRRRSRPRLPRS